MSLTEQREGVCGGNPVIKGTRIPVDTILLRYSHGWTWEETLKNFPDIKETFEGGE